MACKKLTRLISLTEVFMKKFRIEPHGRLQEWVADEKGYFRDEGLDYEFLTSYATQASGYALVQSTETAAPEVKRGAFGNMERGRAADISCACHWAVNMALPPGMAKCGDMPTRLRLRPF